VELDGAKKLKVLLADAGLAQKEYINHESGWYVGRCGP